MNIIIINGPNLNLLGKRQPEIYGSKSFEEFFEELKQEFPDHELEYFQSNHEGAIIDKLHELGFSKYGIVLNPGGLTHTSVSLGDAVAAINAPVVEVHISNIQSREDFRKVNFVESHCKGHFVGLGLDGYKMGVEFLLG
ncbi:MAG: 3-dehydroquinate dehydratase [Cytophagales bacterium]|nr:3-dehydroquinate dehydratase [Cytophagales bacterium]